jgi:hypothetical protein
MIFSFIDISLTNTRLLTLLGMSIGIIELGYRSLKVSPPSQEQDQLETPSDNKQLAVAR